MKNLLLIFVVLAWMDVVCQPPLNKRDQKRKAAFETELEANAKYKELLQAADKAFQAKDYVKARMTYNEAKAYSPENEQWLTSKVNDLDILMARIIAREVDSVAVIHGREVSKVSIAVAQPTQPLESRNEVMDVPAPVEKPNEPVVESTNKKATLMKPTPENSPKPKEEKVRENFDKYPQGLSEETFEFPDHTVRRIIVKDGMDTILYKHVTHRWGGSFYFKDDVSFSERTWNEEVKRFKEKYPTPSKAD